MGGSLHANPDLVLALHLNKEAPRLHGDGNDAFLTKPAGEKGGLNLAPCGATNSGELEEGGIDCGMK